MARSRNILDELVRRRERRWFNDGGSCTAVPQSALGSIVLRAALAGGMVAAYAELGLSMLFFIDKLPSAVPIANLYIGVGKGVVFGVLIALLACHYGMRIRPNTQSLGQGTTDSVVTSITIVILVDAVFAVLFRDVGMGF